MSFMQKNSYLRRILGGGMAFQLLLLLPGFQLATASTCPSFLTPPFKSTALNLPYQIYNLGPAFAQFWAEAQGKTFNEQLKSWNRLIEQPYQRFYDALVWESDGKSDWFLDKYYQLQTFFAKLEQNPDLVLKMMQEFATFEEKIAINTAKFVKYFSDVNFPHAIYAAPAIKFDGKAYRDQVIGFGIDLLVELNQKNFKINPQVLYTHELFHIYHARASQIQKYARIANSPMFFLWQEGLACYLSQLMNQPVSLLEVLFSQDLAQVSDDGIYWLAAKFLQEVNLASNSAQFKNWHSRWFKFYESSPTGPDIPARSGYLLGYRVAQLIAKYYSTNEMAHWNPGQTKAIVQQALTILARQSKTINKPANFYRPDNSTRPSCSKISNLTKK